MVNGKATLEFDVANTHPNGFNSVSIKPDAEGVKFYPAEYFIGPMNPDELFTIEFEAMEDNSFNVDREASEGINMSLTANYNNGINRHINTVGNLNFINASESPESSSKAVLAGGLIIISIPAAFLFYRRRKQ